MVDTDDTRRTTDKATGIWLPTGELKRYGDANKLNKALLSLEASISKWDKSNIIQMISLIFKLDIFSDSYYKCIYVHQCMITFP